MKKIIYVVHSDENENNIFREFVGKGSKQKALLYAKANMQEKTWVNKVEYDNVICTYEYVDTVWSYDMEDK